MEPFAIYAGAQPMTIRTFFTSREEKDLLDLQPLGHGRLQRGATPRARLRARGRADPDHERVSRDDGLRVRRRGRARLDRRHRLGRPWSRSSTRRRRRGGARCARSASTGRLVNSARAHSEDMSKRGFFAHEAPANPATGEPATTPPDRMRKAGYLGSCGENIATSSNPMGAHLMWLHSSGHHRNILGGPWDDMGMGFAGGNATQNFGRRRHGGGDSGGRRPGGRTVREAPQEGPEVARAARESAGRARRPGSATRRVACRPTRRSIQCPSS